MKKTILAIAMLFSVVTNGQDFTGIWQDNGDTSYYIVILNNYEEGYIFSNFSFIEQDTVQEKFISKDENIITTVVHNSDNGWRVFIEYTYIDPNTIEVKYTGDIERTGLLYKQKIVKKDELVYAKKLKVQEKII